MMNRNRLAAIVVVLAGMPIHDATALTIPVTEIGNPGNPPHSPTRLGYVPYTYYLSAEITNAQYAEYWSATHHGDEYKWPYADEGVTASDPAGVSSPLDAIRFVNWLHNGQGNADTESGAYTITTFPRPEESPIMNGYWIAVRNENAKWFIPSLDEWVKAFYIENNDLAQKGALPYSWHGGEWTETIVTGQFYDWDPRECQYYFSAIQSESLTSTNDINYEYPLTPYLSFRTGTTEPVTTNGTPLTWLHQYDLSADTTDPDLDGHLTWQEYICGTNPTNRQSRFTVDITNGTLTWGVVTNRVYSIEHATSLASGFTLVMNGLTESPFTITTTNDTMYFRMKVQLTD